MTIDGLVSRADRTGRRGTILGFTDGRYNIQVRGAGGEAVRIKPGNLASTSDVDTRELAPWPGLSCGPIVRRHDGRVLLSSRALLPNCDARRASRLRSGLALKALELTKA